jgi:hypothetical protein
MPTLYFSYSQGSYSLDGDEPLSSPYTIFWHVGRFLRDKAAEIGYGFRYINLDSVEPVEFQHGDVVIGHLWDTPGSFMQQALSAHIKAKIVLQPYSHGMVSPGDVPRYIEMFLKADALLFVTGEYWFNTIEQSPYASLKPKVTRLDMAVNAALHPFSKTHWNDAGERAVCVIGHDTPTKGYRNVAELARVAGFRLGHFGNTDGKSFEHVPCMTLHGGMLFTPDNIAGLCERYDAVMAVPEADACPTILLEAAAWGLTVFCSIFGGYLPNRPFKEIRLNDMTFNVNQIRQFQNENEYDLAVESLRLRSVIERDYTFSKMCRTIWAKVSEFL